MGKAEKCLQINFLFRSIEKGVKLLDIQSLISDMDILCTSKSIRTLLSETQLGSTRNFVVSTQVSVVST